MLNDSELSLITIRSITFRTPDTENGNFLFVSHRPHRATDCSSSWFSSAFLGAEHFVERIHTQCHTLSLEGNYHTAGGHWIKREVFVVVVVVVL